MEGILFLWVDDIFHAGSDIFRDDVMKKVAKEFLIGQTEEETFKRNADGHISPADKGDKKREKMSA